MAFEIADVCWEPPVLTMPFHCFEPLGHGLLRRGPIRVLMMFQTRRETREPIIGQGDGLGGTRIDSLRFGFQLSFAYLSVFFWEP